MNTGENAVETRGTPALGSCSGSLCSVCVCRCHCGFRGDPGFPRAQCSRVAYLTKNEREKNPTEHFGVGVNLGKDSKHLSLALS